MQQVNGIWLPEDDHLSGMIRSGPIIGGKGTYQFHKFVGAMPHVTRFRHAVDVGGHVGTWSRVMAMWFGRLTAFEPLDFHRECFVKNVPFDGPCKVSLIDCALGTEVGFVRFNVPDKAHSSGGSHVRPGEPEPSDKHTSRMVPLDTLKLAEVDFIKIDCEGYEKNVLLGGEKTIRECKPCVIVEQKPGHGQRFGFGERDAVELLVSWGAEPVWEYAGDFVLRWKKR